MRIIIISNLSYKTGGTELSVQLCDQLKKQGKVESYLCNFPFNKKMVIDQYFENYEIELLSLNHVTEKDVIILPEVYTYLHKKFIKNKTIIWWMSVDNYINSKKLRYCISNRFFTWDYLNVDNFKKYNKHISLNLCQSYYSAEFLRKNNIQNTFFLSDYINENLIQLSSEKINNKKNTILYNPKKTPKEINEFISKNQDIEFFPLSNLNKKQLAEAYSNAKIYIDFGNHPGKDRIPREACIFDCCIITGMEGSAYNDEDIPILKKYKLNQKDINFQNNLRKLLLDIFHSYDLHIKNFKNYKFKISTEKRLFINQVEKLTNQIFYEK